MTKLEKEDRDKQIRLELKQGSTRIELQRKYKLSYIQIVRITKGIPWRLS